MSFSIFCGMEQLLEPGTAQTLLVLLTRGDIYSPPCTPHKQSLFSCWVLGGRNCQVEKEGHLEKMLIAAWEEREGPCVCEWLYTCKLSPKMASVKSRVTAVSESGESALAGIKRFILTEWTIRTVTSWAWGQEATTGIACLHANTVILVLQGRHGLSADMKLWLCSIAVLPPGGGPLEYRSWCHLGRSHDCQYHSSVTAVFCSLCPLLFSPHPFIYEDERASNDGCTLDFSDAGHMR